LQFSLLDLGRIGSLKCPILWFQQQQDSPKVGQTFHPLKNDGYRVNMFSPEHSFYHNVPLKDPPPLQKCI
jgi:hypothetical protein